MGRGPLISVLTQIPLAAPPAPATEDRSCWSVTGPGDLAPVRGAIATLTEARQHVVPLAGASPAPPRSTGSVGAVPTVGWVNERMAIVFSELATNALRHGALPISATVHRSQVGWVVIVEDAAAQDAPSIRQPNADGGYGLGLIARLARTVGWCAFGARKAVWAEVGYEPPHELLQKLAGGPRP